MPTGGTLPWATQITAATLDLNTQNPNSGTMVLSNAGNQQTTTNVTAGMLSVSAAGDLGAALGALTLGGTQTGGGATNGTLLDDDGPHVGGEHHDGGRGRDALGEHRADEYVVGERRERGGADGGGRRGPRDADAVGDHQRDAAG